MGGGRQVASGQWQVARGSAPCKLQVHSAQKGSAPTSRLHSSFRPRDFLENPAVAGICGIFYGKCPTLFIYFVAYFLKNGHVDTFPLCALLHILPTPEASPVKLSRTSRLQENRRQITDHRKLLIGDKWRATFCSLFRFHANAFAAKLFTTRDCCIFFLPAAQKITEWTALHDLWYFPVQSATDSGNFASLRSASAGMTVLVGSGAELFCNLTSVFCLLVTQIRGNPR